MVNCFSEALALGSCSTAERSAVRYALGPRMQQSASVSEGIWTGIVTRLTNHHSTTSAAYIKVEEIHSTTSVGMQ